jgi:hypothetical protein
MVEAGLSPLRARARWSISQGRSLRSIFAPRVIIIQNDSIYKREPGLVDTYKPMVTALIWLILLLVVGHILR